MWVRQTRQTPRKNGDFLLSNTSEWQFASILVCHPPVWTAELQTVGMRRAVSQHSSTAPALSVQRQPCIYLAGVQEKGCGLSEGVLWCVFEHSPGPWQLPWINPCFGTLPLAPASLSSQHWNLTPDQIFKKAWFPSISCYILPIRNELSILVRFFCKFLETSEK